jgi:hypothetical protein
MVSREVFVDLGGVLLDDGGKLDDSRGWRG